MYKLIECRDNYSKPFESLWKYHRYEPNDELRDSESFKSKVKITGHTPVGDNIKDAEIIVRLKYLSNLGKTLEMLLLNWEVNLM